MIVGSEEARRCFSVESNDTIDLIAASLMTPGFMQNQLLLDPEKGPALAAVIKKAMHAQVEWGMSNATEENIRDAIESIREANDMVHIWACSRVGDMVVKMLTAGADKFITKIGLDDPELKKLSDIEKAYLDRKGMVAAGFALRGSFAHFAEFHCNLLPGGQLEFARLQAEVLGSDEMIKRMPESEAVVLTIAAACMKARNRLHTDQDRVTTQVTGFGNAMLAVRDLSMILTLNTKDMMLSMKERLEDVIEQTNEEMGKIQAFADERADQNANVVDFPQSKTVH